MRRAGSARGGSTWRALAAALVAALGCDGPAPADAGAREDAGGEGPVAPAPPALPVFTPCPAGWAATDSGEGFDVCEPPPWAACPPGQARFLDAEGCAPVGAPCPAGDWAEAPPGATVVYVRAGASGGDGSRDAPYGLIRDAIVRAPPGATVSLARGTYEEAVDLYGGLRLLGACAAQTILAPREGEVAVRAAERGSALADVTIRPAGALLGVRVTGELALEGVVIEGATDTGIFVADGGSLDARRVVVRDVIVGAPLPLGRGLTVFRARARVERALFERCPGGAILVSTAGELEARSVMVRESGAELLGGPQVIAQGVGARLVLADAAIEDAEGTGIFVNEDGVVELDQIVARRLRAPAGATRASAGVFVRSRGVITARRVRVEDTSLLGLGLVEGARAELEDVLVARVGPVTIDGDPLAMGLLYGGPHLRVRRLVVRDVDRTGVQVEGGTLSLEDVSIARTGAGPGPSYVPMGLAQRDADATLRRVAIEGTTGAGLYATGSRLTLEDVAVRDVSDTADARFGRGVELVGGEATLARVLVQSAREVGLHVLEGASVTASQLVVRDTRGRSCQDGACRDAPGGLALAVIDARATVREFALDRARLCGALVAGPTAALDLRAGTIREASVGACVQVDGYDVARLTDGVEFRGNGTNVDATDHATPAPSDPLAGLPL